MSRSPDTSVEPSAPVNDPRTSLCRGAPWECAVDGGGAEWEKFFVAEILGDGRPRRAPDAVPGSRQTPRAAQWRVDGPSPAHPAADHLWEAIHLRSGGRLQSLSQRARSTSGATPVPIGDLESAELRSDRVGAGSSTSTSSPPEPGRWVLGAHMQTRSHVGAITATPYREAAAAIRLS